MMKIAKNDDGLLLFKNDEYLNSQQIESCFRRIIQKKKNELKEELRIDNSQNKENFIEYRKKFVIFSIIIKKPTL